MATNRNKFAAAYITIVNINALGWNTTQIIPFVRHADIGLVGTPLDVGNHELKGKDRPEFWAHTVVFGYESEHDEDGDPTSEDPLLGITRKPFGGIFHTFSAVYVEAIRDHQFSQVPASVFVSVNERQNFRNRVLEEMYATIAHEIGHAPGNQLQGDDHDEKWLMTAGTAAATRLGFGPKSVKRFRAAKSWSE